VCLSVKNSTGSKYYADAQFAPIQTQLQTVANAYVQGDGFNLSRAANQLREDLRALSPSIYPRDQQLRSNIFIIISKRFIGPSGVTELPLVILITAHLRKRGSALQNVAWRWR